MSQTAITLVFERWKTQQAATGEPVLLDEFVFANVPGLDPDLPIDRSETLPPDSQIVHRQAVSRKGVVNENAVVHSVVLGADVGDFSFNWVGLVNKASGTLAMIVHAPVQQKLKTKDGQQGNVLTRSFLMEFTGAQTETAINTPAETWQIDFTARMGGIDERQRLENIDIYGAGAFFGDGYLVGKTGNQYFVTQGVGYVAGLRAQLSANQNITVTTKPVKVWLDVSWAGTLTSVWGVQNKITVATALADYVKDGVQHYVFAVASIDADGNITDLRPKGSLNDQSIKEHEKSRNHPDATTTKKGFTQLSNETDSDDESKAATPKAVKTLKDSLGTAAGADVTDGARDTTAGRVLKVGDYGFGLTRSPLTTGIDFSTYRFILGEHLFVRMSTCTNIPAELKADSHYFVFVHGLRDASGSPGLTFINYADPSEQWTAYGRDSVNGGLTWTLHRTYNTGFKPTAGDVGAVPSSGGSVEYLNNAKYYGTKPEYWQGGGGFAGQYTDGTAPFFAPRFPAPAGVSNYFPIVKGSTAISGQGWGSAVSFGILRNGGNDFGSAVIHIIGDNGVGTIFGFNSDGTFNAPNAIIAGGGLYDTPGVRAYSSNNPPPQQDLSPYATTAWVNGNFATSAWTVANFMQAGIRLASLGTADNGNNDGNYAYAPDGAVVTAVMQKTNYTAVQYRYVQYNIGGNWYTAWVA
ncbi:phage tail-collar fiber domain-containing protein [Enterobacter cloacae]